MKRWIQDHAEGFVLSVVFALMIVIAFFVLLVG